jgi:hypothetical protein
MLYYKPRPGEELGKADVVAPLTMKLVVFEGQPEQGKFVDHVTFKGLSFQHQGYTLPPAGYEPYQAARYGCRGLFDEPATSRSRIARSGASGSMRSGSAGAVRIAALSGVSWRTSAQAACESAKARSGRTRRPAPITSP